MPYGSYATPAIAVENAVRMMKESGADAVKLQGGREMFATIKAVADAGVPVMSHVGLLPHRVHMLGGFKMQGRTAEDALKIIDNAKAIQDAGAIGLEIEAMPYEVGKAVDQAVDIFTFSIGAGSAGTCQLLNGYDLLGAFVHRVDDPVERFHPVDVDRRGIAGVMAEQGAMRTVGVEGIEAGVQKRTQDLACPVRPEVHEQDAIIIRHCRRQLAISLNGCGQHKFIVFTALVGRFKPRQCSAGSVTAGGSGQQIIGLLNAVPVVIPVHCIIAPGDAGNPAAAQFGKQGLGFFQRGPGTARWRIAAIEECVQENTPGSAFCSQAHGGENLLLMAVHATRGQQAQDVYRPPRGNRLVDGAAVGWIVVKRAIGDSLVYPGDILVNHPAGSQAHMAHLGVAHLAAGQPHVGAGGGNERPGRLGPEAVPHRRATIGDRIVAVGGRPISSREDLRDDMKTRVVGEEVSLTLEDSAGERRVVYVKLAKKTM